MFKLLDGREHLWQWDLDRQIAVSDSTVTEVHFCNKTDDCSLVVEVVDGIANIPNILLQQPFDIRVYAYCDCYTKVEATFKVKARTKPSDYVYTETETLQYSTLGNRIDELQEQVEALDVSNFYTRAETDTAIEEAREVYYLDFSEISATWETASEEGAAILTRIRNGEQLALFIKGYVGPTYAAADVINGSKTIYLTVHFTDNTPDTCICRWLCLLNDDGVWQIKSETTKLLYYATTDYVDDAVGNINIPTVPSNVSAFTNDAGYQTAAQVNTAITTALNNIPTAEGGSY